VKSFTPSGFEQTDFPMSIGIVEKLFEPQASSFPPNGLLRPIGFNFKSSKLTKNEFALVSTKEVFSFFCLLTKETRTQAKRCETRKVAERSRSIDFKTVNHNSINYDLHSPPFTPTPIINNCILITHFRRC
jgi:hypothetical protein